MKVVVYLKFDESIFELLFGDVFCLVDVEAPVDEVGNLVLPPGWDIPKRRIVVYERGAGEAYAVEIKDDVDRVDAPGLVSDFHTPQNDLVQKTS